MTMNKQKDTWAILSTFCTLDDIKAISGRGNCPDHTRILAATIPLKTNAANRLFKTTPKMISLESTDR
ncbi:hypothetical protein L596_018453 [Steinernema carpocapsae]|uniref:Uncharacterized protein n=1 Tax=Steinernema carpocapsae TaxID=34508 RepID=A0A4U5N4N2_STECR|nr:hypothetical protein L596_018453 [Steinernema carpocapsae]